MKYKHLIYLLMFTLLPIIGFGADNVQSFFEKGNQQYAKGQYNEALKSYQKVLDAGYESAAVYFNMGNANYKNGDIAPALLYYEKAHKLSPGDEDINFNIRLVNLKTTDKIDPTPELFLAQWWRGFILMCSAKALAVWSIVIVLLASGMLILYLFTRSVIIKKTAFFSAIILFFVGLTAMFIGNRQENYFDNHHQAIIFSGSVLVKSAPGDNGKTLFVLHEGTKVDVLENQKSSIKIKLANGNVGWIGVADVKDI
jgi:tetratricopeptide (TPR) repeat protein